MQTRRFPVLLVVCGVLACAYGFLRADANTLPTAAAPQIFGFYPLPPQIAAGGSSTLSWQTAGATTVTIDQGIGTVAGTGTKVVTPAATTKYTLTASNANGSVTAFATVTVLAPASPPSVVSFTASPNDVSPGQPATLSWTTKNTNFVIIDKLSGTKNPSGSATVSPTTTTTYTLTANGSAGTAMASVTVNVETNPLVNVTSFPAAMIQAAGTGGATTTYALTNSGGSSTSITLAQTGTFFSQSPPSFSLAPGASQVVTLTAGAVGAGAYDGASLISGVGVPEGMQIPVRLLSSAPPDAPVTADPTANRVDVSGTTNPTGSVSWRNNGTGTLTGILSADVPWILPRTGVVTIAPGQTVDLPFTIDRAKRPDSATLFGSAQGNLSLSFLSGPGQPFAKRALDSSTAVPSVSLVKVVDTVQPAITVAGIPTLGATDVGLVIPGVGHVTGKNGTLFVSDVSLLNPQGGAAVDDVKFYYSSFGSSAGSAKATSLPSVSAQTGVAVADVVKTVFAGADEVGTLHIRSKDASKLAVAATVATANNPAGTYGNTIPVFRTDRSAEASAAIVLPGVRKDATTHTNLYVQETAGSDAMVQIDFLAADGSTIGTRPPDPIAPFKLLQLVDAVPANAATVVITNTSAAGAKIAAYATPVDEASGDTWTISDWSRQLGYGATEAVVIPVAGTVHGANGTFYRTDVAIANRGTAAASGTLRYIARTGEKIDRPISLGAKQSEIITDAVGSRFGVSGDSTGFLTFTPIAGSFAISSRTFTTVGSKPDTFGTGVPVLAAASALASGGARPIAGLTDATRSTVVAGRPGTYRTNFALMETANKSVTVRVTFRFNFPAGAKAQGIGAASRDYALNGNQFLLLNSIAGEILGAARLQYGDLTNVEADFQVIAGQGSVVLFTSSVDNATGDSVLRTE